MRAGWPVSFCLSFGPLFVVARPPCGSNGSNSTVSELNGKRPIARANFHRDSNIPNRRSLCAGTQKRPCSAANSPFRPSDD
jgi:hypothetical protein